MVVRGLGLDLAHEDVLGVGELVLVKGVVLDRSADEPEGSGVGLNVQSSASVDGGLGIVGVVNIVVGGPEPVVLHVEAAGLLGDVHGHEGRDTVGVDRR